MISRQSEQVQRADIVIVGAGLVGCSIALALSMEHPSLRIQLVEAGSFDAIVQSSSDYDNRVVALNQASVSFFERLGLWQQVLHIRACPYKSMAVWDGEGNGLMEFFASECQLSELGFIVENRILLGVLKASMHAATNIHISDLNKVVSITERDKGASVPLNVVTLASGVSIETPLVIAADGAQSPVRAALNIPLKRWDTGHTAIVATVANEHHHQFCAWQRFSATGPLAMLPLLGHDETWCSIVWSLDHEVAERNMQLNDCAFNAALERCFEARLGSVQSSCDRVAIPLWQSHAQEYGRAGVLLVGDAAHTVHPLAGQGVNLGLADVSVVLQEVRRALIRGVPLSHVSLQKRYQRQRRPLNEAALMVMKGFQTLFCSDSVSSLTLRNRGMRCLNGNLAIKQLLVKGASGTLLA